MVVFTLAMFDVVGEKEKGMYQALSTVGISAINSHTETPQGPPIKLPPL